MDVTLPTTEMGIGTSLVLIEMEESPCLVNGVGARDEIPAPWVLAKSPLM